MKQLIAIMSSLLLILQMPIQAAEASNDSSQPITVSNVTIDKLINDYKSALEDENKDTMSIIATDFLDIYKNTNDPELKLLIIEVLLLKDKDGWTFLKWSLDSGDDIIGSLANALLDIYQNTNNPELKGKITEALLMSNDSDETFIYWAASKGNSDIIQTTIDALKESPNVLKNLLIPEDHWRTFLHYAADNGHINIFYTTIEALKDEHIGILSELLDFKSISHSTAFDHLSTRSLVFSLANQKTEINKLQNTIINDKIFNYETALQNNYEYDKIISSAYALVDTYKNTNDPELKLKIIEALLLKDEDGWTFLHYAAKNYYNNIIVSTIEALKNKPDILKELLNSDEYDRTFLHLAAENDNDEIINKTIQSLKDDHNDLLIALLNLKNDEGKSVIDMVPNIDNLK